MTEVEIVLSSDAQEVFERLNQEAKNSKISRTILKAIKKKAELIKINRTYGDAIKKSLIPKEYIKKFEINNLFRVELPNYWRMLYTLETNENRIQIIAFVLDIINHKEYDKKFGY